MRELGLTCRALLAMLGMAGMLLVGACSSTRPFTDAQGQPLPGSIASMERLQLGGVSQSVWFRGLDTQHPAVILLHGGPGVSESALFRYYDAALEQHFLMVYWEQRGTGRSYSPDLARESMTLAQFVRDLDELVDHVRQRFKQRKVILLAHSWGSELGTTYAYQHPEKVAAYVGIGQVVNVAEGERVSYQWALEQAVKQGEQRAIAQLQAMSPGPKSVDDELKLGEWVESFGGSLRQGLTTGKLIWAALSVDETELWDLVRFGRGNRFSLESLRPEYSRLDLTTYRHFKTPIIFLLGRHDWHVPSVLAEQYFNSLESPGKRLIWFEQSAHNPPFEEPERFVRVMLDEIRPLALRHLASP